MAIDMHYRYQISFADRAASMRSVELAIEAVIW